MTFVTPTGYNPSDLDTSPRSKATSAFPQPNIMTIPGRLGEMFNNAIAGPSGTASSSRRTSKEYLPRPISPSSAPPNPSVISVTHPPEFIHTHHPRRGSLTPLGLNVISPMPPVQMSYGTTHPPHSPVRSIGFTPTQAYQDAFARDHCRRGSGASSSSTLTLSRPPQFGHGSNGNGGRERRRSSLAPAYPPGFNPERRRSSLTPANPTLAPASPTRAHANGVLSRPGSSDGQGGSGLHTRHHTTHGSRPLSSVRNQHAPVNGETRRGSMPQLHYSGWTGPRWNPSLPPQRGSVGEETLPDEGFKFGSIGTNPSGPSTPGPAPPPATQKAIEISPSQRSARAVRMDAFQEAEAAEAERQRKAFISATFGDDGRRARERLSIGGPMTQAPSSPTRRPSLMLWEKLGMAAAAKVIEPDVAASSAPTLVLPRAMQDEYGPRRGSLPIAIPLSPHGVSPSSRRERLSNDPELRDPEDAFGEEDEDEDEEEYEDRNQYGDEYDHNKLAPIRPAPPLLPLSDPGPRLLPSTLALQRASHLLNARRLQADPLPHPLPPSLHPPIPVDVTEFDIDFILAGSQAQLGRSKRSSNAQTNTSPNAPMDDIAPFASSAPAPTLRLGAEDEDTFAKFVGKFDDEYGGRRGEWTFHAKPPTPGMESHQQEGLRAVWESPGAGAFEIFANGDVRSARNGTIWRTNRKGICEYEIEYVNRPSGFFERLTHSIGADGGGGGGPRHCYVLATKAVHCEHGGIKTSGSSSTFSPTTVSFASSSGGSPSENRSRQVKDRLRVSISEATRTMRLDSSDSSSTATPSNKLSSSLPSGAVLTPKKNRRPSRDKEDEARTDQTSSSSSNMPRLLRARSRDPGDEDRKSKDKDPKDKSAGFFKKSLMAPFKNTNFIAQYEEKKAQREEREREKQQAHSWAGNSTHAGFIHPSGKNTPPYPSPQQRSSSNTINASINAGGASSSRTSTSDDPRLGGSDSIRQSTGSLTAQLREGKMWNEVPEDAVAMVIPDQGDIPVGSHNETSTLTSVSETSIESRQALLVWYVPFNGDRSPTASSSQGQVQAQGQGSRLTGLHPSTSTESQLPPSPSTSLPKFQKLLRRRTSKDKEMVKGPSSQRSSDVEQVHITTTKPPKHPLPFRSFRIVARIVDLDELRSTTTDTNEDTSVRKSRLNSTPSTTSASVPAPSPAPIQRPTALSVDSVLPLASKPPLTTTKTDDTTRTSSTAATGATGGTGVTGVSQTSTAPTSTILAGRTISTVIAVCHSRSQGVEFVLEGLDRLGYCVGESAWGPTGYEEWRGTGLSERGRELLELLWAGCTGVMGLNG